MPSEFPFAIVNSESTILAVKALKEYLGSAQRHGRQPIDPVGALELGPEGECVESGGGTSGYEIGSSCYLYSFTSDGRVLYASASTPSRKDVWTYLYSKFKVRAASRGTYNVTVALLLEYWSQDTLGNHNEIYVVTKLMDSNDSVIAQWEDMVLYLENNWIVD